MQADFGTMEKCQNADLTLNSSLLTEYHKIPKNEPRDCGCQRTILGVYIRRGLLWVLWHFEFGGFIYREAYFWNVMVGQLNK